MVRHTVLITVMMRPAAASPAPNSNRSGLLVFPTFANSLIAVSLACLALITLVSPGATRMFAWPWSLALAGVVVLPGLALVMRGFDSKQPLVLPTRGWFILGLGAVFIVLLSALVSPHRGVTLLWSAPLLAGVAVFSVGFDWLNAEPRFAAQRRERFEGGILAAGAAMGAASMGGWLAHAPTAASGELFSHRNQYPLGHPNYTAGLALLLLPTAVAVASRRQGRTRIAAAIVGGLAIAMLFTSGSRGGLVGLAALAVAGAMAAPITRRRKWQLGVGLVVAGLAFAAAHPRTRAMFRAADPAAAPNISNVQREAMLLAGWRMGQDQPLLGWGPGATPLVFPRYRGGLDGGAENFLQLHALPIQLWAELGGAGLACLLAFIGLGVWSAGRDPVAALTLAAYGAFSLTDWQLDVPIFATAVALFATRLAPPATTPSSNHLGRGVGAIALVAIAVVALFGHREPAPELNSRALTLARGPTGADRAVVLFRESLALDADQEIAHFNLGWLLVVREPATAETHFAAAAQLVPDKGGLYFGLGLARLNQGRREAAARAFALECLNDPAFLTSPWWRDPVLAAVRNETAAEFGRLLDQVSAALPPGTWAANQVALMTELAPPPGQLPPGRERNYRRERTGYPVLMRNLDLPTPVDLYDVREWVPEPAVPALAALPPKGWLPSPLLLTLLAESVSNKN